jgi:hypothetical protein
MKTAQDDEQKRKANWTEIEDAADEAYAVYVRTCQLSKSDPDALETWRTAKYPDYATYRSGWRKAAQEVEYLRKKYYGETLGKVQAKLNSAQDSGKYLAGYAYFY